MDCYMESRNVRSSVNSLNSNKVSMSKIKKGLNFKPVLSASDLE